MRGASHSGFSTLIRRIKLRTSIGTFGRPPRERDFHRQYSRKPERCQRSTVSGCTIVMVFLSDAKSRHSQAISSRSAQVSRASKEPAAEAHSAGAAAS